MRDHEKKVSDFGQRLLNLLKANDLSRTEFAEKLDLSRSYVTDLIYGRAKATGGKFWDCIRKHFPRWEEFLRDHVKSPPGSIVASTEGEYRVGGDLRLAPPGRPSHEDLINQFQNKALARELNQMLLDAGVAGSNPVVPTNKINRLRVELEERHGQFVVRVYYRSIPHLMKTLITLTLPI
jgi:transcriptional regulator with XRE-family HTH domain